MGETQYSKGIKISLPSKVCKIRLRITQKQRSTYVMTLHRRWFVFGCFVSSGMCETRSDSKFCKAFFSVFSCGDRRCNSRSLWRYHNTMLWQPGEKERRLPHYGGCHAQDDQDIYYQVCVSKLGFPPWPIFTILQTLNPYRLRYKFYCLELNWLQDFAMAEALGPQDRSSVRLSVTTLFLIFNQYYLRDSF